jgi:hypothetical protein
MLLNTNFDPHDKSTCTLTYEEEAQWLQAVWRGYVDPDEAMRGAEAYLQHAAQFPCAFFLNDNSQLLGPWFESLDWLAQVWVPRAVQLGLRFVAHVVPIDQHYDILTSQLLQGTPVPFELQIFQNLADARHWLQQAQQANPTLQSLPGFPRVD